MIFFYHQLLRYDSCRLSLLYSFCSHFSLLFTVIDTITSILFLPSYLISNIFVALTCTVLSLELLLFTTVLLVVLLLRRVPLLLFLVIVPLLLTSPIVTILPVSLLFFRSVYYCYTSYCYYISIVTDFVAMNSAGQVFSFLATRRFVRNMHRVLASIPQRTPRAGV